jgi:hypothetical protein
MKIKMGSILYVDLDFISNQKFFVLVGFRPRILVIVIPSFPIYLNPFFTAIEIVSCSNG